MLSAVQGGDVDRVPLHLPGFTFRDAGEIDALDNPRRREIAARYFPHSCYEITVPSQANRYLVTPEYRIRRRTEELGGGASRLTGEIDTPGGALTFVKEFNPAEQTWWNAKYPVETMDDIAKIRSVPWEVPEDIRIPDRHDLPADFHQRGILATRISSPVVCVAGMMSYQWFLELCLTEKTLITELTEICRLRILDLLEALFKDGGIEYVWMGGSEWVTPPMASPETYDALVQEQERSLIAAIHDRGDIPVHVHCHGQVRHALPRTIERGADYTEPVEPPPDGDITLKEAKQLAAGRISLGGNVECRVLCNGSADDTEAATRAAFEGGKSRFVLRPTEGPTPALPEREYMNYLRLIDVWEELSPID